VDLLELTPEVIPKGNLLLLAYRGSVAHNMYVPNTDPNSIDDVDLMGVFLAPKNYYIGLGNFKTTIEKFVEEDGVVYDCVYYELRHFVKLLLKGNPNVLSMLWLEPEHYVYKNYSIETLLTNRDIFSAKHVYNSFTGYAYGQLKRMEAHNKRGYMGEKRKRLVKKFGYDTKNAAHLIRLLKMGVEFLERGSLNVARHEDAQFLLDIKLGKWSLEDVKDAATLLFNLARMAKNNSTLPDKPDTEKADKIVSSIIYDYIVIGLNEIR
jgi:predicted nucleotidyltransferase